MHGIELEVVYTKIAVERQQEIRVLVPVRRVIGRIWPEPKPELHTFRTRFLNYLPKTVWKPDRVDVPEPFHLPPRAPAAFLAGCETGGIGRTPLLPAVVDLNNVYS